MGNLNFHIWKYFKLCEKKQKKIPAVRFLLDLLTSESLGYIYWATGSFVVARKCLSYNAKQQEVTNAAIHKKYQR